MPPDLPTLLNIIANGFTSPDNFTTTEDTFVIDRNEVIELVIHGSPNGKRISEEDGYVSDFPDHRAYPVRLSAIIHNLSLILLIFGSPFQLSVLSTDHCVILGLI